MTQHPHELTAGEVRERFLEHVRGIVDYWEREARAESFRARLEGIAFSILVAIDGEAAALPSFVLAPRPHPDDEEFLRNRGESWYPTAPDVSCDIAGELHSLLFSGSDQ